MRSRTITTLLSVFSITGSLAAGGTPAVSAEENPDRALFRRIDEAVASGALSADLALLNKLAYVFDPDALDPRFRIPNPTPVKCATDLIREFYATRAQLSPGVAGEIESYLSRSAPSVEKAAALAVYNSPGGNFRLTYSTTGANAVPADDVDPANGVPDYVEWCGAYCDSSWSREVGGLGFMAPALTGGRYDVSFEEMGAYGYTTLSGGGTRIVLHRSFIGFPANTDPDGDQKGAAKVTVAHEFKHASQYQGSLWSEGNWVELDATWAEDAVYDSTNDYYNYLDSGSPISSPQSALDSGGGGSYEDCVWQEHLSQSHGNAIIREIWERRMTHQSEGMKVTYDSVLAAHGSGMSPAYEDFMQWCYLTGTHATSDIPHFEEAPDYPTSTIAQTASSLPWSTSGSVNRLAAHFFRIENGGTFGGSPRIVFTGTAGSQLALRVVYHRTDGSESAQEIALDGANSANVILSHSWPNLSALGVLVINPKRTGTADAYSVSVSQEIATDVASGETAAAAPLRFALEPNAPNPARPGTQFRFRLAERGPVDLAVFDAAGRRVATLVGGASLEPGEHVVAWDGRTDAGRAAAPGAYVYRLVAGRYSETRKLLLVR
jgi:hypothetical protein